jgi:hypothetical protein
VALQHTREGRIDQAVEILGAAIARVPDHSPATLACCWAWIERQMPLLTLNWQPDWHLTAQPEP